MDLTPEELALFTARREAANGEAAERRALEAVLPRARSTAERRALQEMIAARGGPPVTTCRCGEQVTPESGSLLECPYCYARGYGK